MVCYKFLYFCKKRNDMEYTDNGYLPKGCHAMVASDFIDEFCHHSNRAPYEGAIINIFDFAR